MEQNSLKWYPVFAELHEEVLIYTAVLAKSPEDVEFVCRYLGLKVLDMIKYTEDYTI